MPPRGVARRMTGAFPVASAGLIGGLALLVSGAAWRSMLRTGNASILFVAAAFAVMGAKNVAKAVLLLTGGVGAPWEVAFTLADLAVVGLVAWPLLSGGWRA
jgi:hypothetical protein